MPLCERPILGRKRKKRKKKKKKKKKVTAHGNIFFGTDVNRVNKSPLYIFLGQGCSSSFWIFTDNSRLNPTFSILLTLNPLPAAIIAFAVALITPKGLFSSLLKEIQFVMSSKKECFNFVIQRGSWKPTKNVIDILCDIDLEANLLDWNELEMMDISDW